MSETRSHIEDWSLQAIVRGPSGDLRKIVDMDVDGQDSFFNHLHQQFDEDLSSFSDILEGSTGFSDELEELYKPFYPATATFSLPDRTVVEFQKQNLAEDKASNDQSDQSSDTSPVAVASATAVYTPKYKKRKNQIKRVVIQVSAEGLSSDMWAWRKYGQKPIKGSPYSRSYYRCSSSKGCLARKQVEQSCTDRGMFIITYTAEHSHSQPTRRNSLAGTVRQKFPTPNGRPVKQEKTDSLNSSQQAETDVVAPARLKEEDKEEILKPYVGENQEFVMSDFIFNEDFFSGLEEFDEFVVHTSAQQFSIRSCSLV